MSRTVANLLLLTAGAVWGMGFVAQQTAMEDIGPMLFIGLRFLIAGICVLPFALAEQKRPDMPGFLTSIRQNRTGFFLVGLAFFLGMTFQQVGLITTSVTNAGFLTALYVILVPLLMVTVLRRRQPAIVWPAAILSIAGIYMLSGGDLSTLNFGDLLVIICALFWAGHVILTGKYAQVSGNPVTMACTQFFVTSLLAFAIAALLMFTGTAEPLPSLAQLQAAMPEILYAGTIAGGLGFTLQAVGQRYTSESAAAVLISTESLFAAMFGAVFLGERLMFIGYIGCGLIFSAILLVQLMPRRTKTAPS